MCVRSVFSDPENQVMSDEEDNLPGDIVPLPSPPQRWVVVCICSPMVLTCYLRQVAESFGHYFFFHIISYFLC